jgi:hypothetical protein
MANNIPDEFRDLFEKKAFAHLGTLMNDGTPQVTASGAIMTVPTYSSTVQKVASRTRICGETERLRSALRTPTIPTVLSPCAVRSLKLRTIPTITSTHSQRNTLIRTNTPISNRARFELRTQSVRITYLFGRDNVLRSVPGRPRQRWR